MHFCLWKPRFSVLIGQNDDLALWNYRSKSHTKPHKTGCDIYWDSFGINEKSRKKCWFLLTFIYCRSIMQLTGWGVLIFSLYEVKIYP